MFQSAEPCDWHYGASLSGICKETGIHGYILHSCALPRQKCISNTLKPHLPPLKYAVHNHHITLLSHSDTEHVLLEVYTIRIKLRLI